MIQGACLCGALAYEVDRLHPTLVHCHCSRCRKHHGAPFASFVTAPADALRWVQGEESVTTYSSAAGPRRSCGTCGAVAPTLEPERVILPAGNLGGDLGELRGQHVFVGSRAPWHVIADGLPQHEGALPGEPTPSVEPRPEVHVDGGVHGSCLCGAVTFEVRGAPARWYQCHCSRCRRARSAAHGSNTFFPAAQFAWRSGRELVRGYRPPDAERFTTSFCSLCGGGAPTQRGGVPFVLVPAGLLDGELGRRPDAHIHVASRAPWYPLADDGLPRFAELPPA